MKLIKFSFTLQSKHKEDFALVVCKSKYQVQKIIKADIGYLPANMTECFFVDKDKLSTIILRKNTSLGVVAHEVFHAVSHTAKKLGLDPNDYRLVCPDNDDFAYQPAEVVADLFHALFVKVLYLRRACRDKVLAG